MLNALYQLQSCGFQNDQVRGLENRTETVSKFALTNNASRRDEYAQCAQFTIQFNEKIDDSEFVRAMRDERRSFSLLL